MGQCGCWENPVQSSWTTFGLMRKEGCGLPVKVDGEDEQNAKFILSQIRYSLVDTHVWDWGGSA